MGERVGESSRWNHVVLREMEDVPSKKLEHWKAMSSTCSCNGISLQSTSKGEEKILRGVGLLYAACEMPVKGAPVIND